MLSVLGARFGYKRRTDDTLAEEYLCDEGNNPPFTEVRDIEVKVSLSNITSRVTIGSSNQRKTVGAFKLKTKDMRYRNLFLFAKSKTKQSKYKYKFQRAQRRREGE